MPKLEVEAGNAETYMYIDIYVHIQEKVGIIWKINK